MIRNVLIDPYMFLISGEEEIRENIEFFEKLIKLFQNGSISIYLYQGWTDSIKNMAWQPFPIALKDITSPSLREHIQRLNQSFANILSSQFKPIDIEVCDGEQEIDSDQALLSDEKYYELLSVLLSSCYNKVNFEEVILTGQKKQGLQIADEFGVKCECSCKKYSKKYRMGSIREYENEKDILYEELQDMLINWSENFVENPETKRGKHHNPLQPKDIKKFTDIEIKSRKVLKVLRYFGLYKIILKDFHWDSSETAGTITVKRVEDGNNSEIVEGELFFSGGMKHTVELYFPVGIGRRLCQYTEQRFEYNAVLKLKEELCV